MEVRAILILNEDQSTPQDFAGAHLPMLDVVGKPVFAHIIDRLKKAGAEHVCVVTSQRPDWEPGTADVTIHECSAESPPPSK